MRATTTTLLDERARQAALSRLVDHVEHRTVITLPRATERVPVDLDSDGGAA